METAGARSPGWLSTVKYPIGSHSVPICRSRVNSAEDAPSSKCKTYQAVSPQGLIEAERDSRMAHFITLSKMFRISKAVTCVTSALVLVLGSESAASALKAIAPYPGACHHRNYTFGRIIRISLTGSSSTAFPHNLVRAALSSKADRAVNVFP